MRPELDEEYRPERARAICDALLILTVPPFLAALVWSICGVMMGWAPLGP